MLIPVIYEWYIRFIWEKLSSEKTMLIKSKVFLKHSWRKALPNSKRRQSKGFGNSENTVVKNLLFSSHIFRFCDNANQLYCGTEPSQKPPWLTKKVFRHFMWFILYPFLEITYYTHLRVSVLWLNGSVMILTPINAIIAWIIKKR